MALGAIISVGSIPGNTISEASRVEIYERLGEPTLYSIVLPNDIKDNDFPMMTDNRIDQGAEISISVIVNNNKKCLVKGPVYSQQIQLLHGGEGSSLEARGADNLITMDREYKSKVWSNVTDSQTVMSIIGDYGLIPDVDNTSSRHIENKHNLLQRATDLQFIKKLGRRNGCIFWISCNEVGLETVHFKRPPLNDTPAIDLIINRDDYNIDAFEILWDVEQPTSVVGKQMDLANKNNIDGEIRETPQTILGDRNLKNITGDTRNIHITAPGDDAGNIQARGEGALIEADWFIKAYCRTSLHKLGDIVQAHTIVNVIGIGTRHSGKYLVSGVKHLIDTTGHIMEIELVRNGWNT